MTDKRIAKMTDEQIAALIEKLQAEQRRRIENAWLIEFLWGDLLIQDATSEAA